eukprot:6196041-Alexandrium_andersonii.AAC.1
MPLQHGHDTVRSRRMGLPAATQSAQHSSWNMCLHTSLQHISPGANGWRHSAHCAASKIASHLAALTCWRGRH